jgi:hypothetical protein
MNKFAYKDYTNYLDAQKKTTAKKLGLGFSWIRESDVMVVCANFDNELDTVLCHGTRAGGEQELFVKHLQEGATVLGTELHPDGAKYPRTIVHDFNIPVDEWKGKFSLVYSNSLDHCYDPNKTLAVWAEQVSPTGRLIIEGHPGSGPNISVSESDPFNASDLELIGIVEKLGMTLDKVLLPGQCKHKGSLIVFKH